MKASTKHHLTSREDEIFPKASIFPETRNLPKSFKLARFSRTRKIQMFEVKSFDEAELHSCGSILNEPSTVDTEIRFHMPVSRPVNGEDELENGSWQH